MTELERARTFRTLHHYDNIVYCSALDCTTEAVFPAREYTLNYVISGEMVLSDGYNSTYIHHNECAFIPRAHHISISLKSHDNQPYSGIAIIFTRQYLKKIYRTHQPIQIPNDTPRLYSSSMQLPHTIELTRLFTDLIPYCDRRLKPEADFISSKSRKSLDTLLHISNRFAPTLFDFRPQWKIDIIDFLNLNYAHDWSISDLAHYTGRSLATFKREFSKITHLSPRNWLIAKRLNVAYERLKEEPLRISEIAAEVGFKNSSHFAMAFKSQYGQPPSTFAAMAQRAKLTKK